MKGACLVYVLIFMGTVYVAGLGSLWLLLLFVWVTWSIPGIAWSTMKN